VFSARTFLNCGLPRLQPHKKQLKVGAELKVLPWCTAKFTLNPECQKIIIFRKNATLPFFTIDYLTEVILQIYMCHNIY